MTGVNKTSLAKAIAIVAGIILSAIAIAVSVTHFPFMGLVILYATMVLCVIGMFVFMIYEQIEFNKQHKN